MWNNAVNAWWPLLFYAATDAPLFRKGMIAMICICVATLGVTAFVWWLERREHVLKRRHKPTVAGVVEEREEKLSSEKERR